MKHSLLVPLLASLALGCGDSERGKSVQASANLAEGIFASVGSELLPAGILATSTEPSPNEIADRHVHDALYALHARDVLPSRASSVERGVLARALLEEMEKEEISKRPVAPEELEEALARNWLLFDRPRAVRAIEIFVAIPPLHDDRAEFAELKKVREQAAKTYSPESFRTLLESFQTDFEIQATSMPPVAESGKVVRMQAQDHRIPKVPQEIVDRAVKLTFAGEVSPIFSTEAGLHFLYAQEIVPERRPPRDETRAKLVKGIAAQRLRPRLAKLTEAAKAAVVYPREDLAPLTRLVWRKK